MSIIYVCLNIKEESKPVSKEESKPVPKEETKPVPKEESKPVSKEETKPVPKEESKSVAVFRIPNYDPKVRVCPAVFKTEIVSVLCVGRCSVWDISELYSECAVCWQV
jgi:hypothetical protein